MADNTIDEALAREAKAIVALAFRTGPIENLHAGKIYPVCTGRPDYSKITDAEIKTIMKNAVDVYKFALMKTTDPVRYRKLVEYGNQIAHAWDDPVAG